jgi:hypothetical protein
MAGMHVPIWICAHSLASVRALYACAVVAISVQSRMQIKITSGSPFLSSKEVLEPKMTVRPDGPRSGRSAVVARTVRACAESVRVSSFSRDLLPKTAGLTRKSVVSGSRPPLYIDEGLRPIEPLTIEPIQLLSRIYFQHN